MRVAILCAAVGLWSIYRAFIGIVPQSRVLWGKDESGQRMRVAQRIIFGFGGALLIGVALLMFLFARSK